MQRLTTRQRQPHAADQVAAAVLVRDERDSRPGAVLRSSTWTGRAAGGRAPAARQHHSERAQGSAAAPLRPREHRGRPDTRPERELPRARNRRGLPARERRDRRYSASQRRWVICSPDAYCFLEVVCLFGVAADFGTSSDLDCSVRYWVYVAVFERERKLLYSSFSCTSNWQFIQQC